MRMQLNRLRRRISWMTILMVLQRSPVLPLAKNAVLLLGTIVEKCWTWKAVLPTLSAVGGWHSLSGASSYVTSSQANPASVNTGDSFSFTFYTRGYRANSFRVDGLPSGLSYNGSSSNPIISGTPQTAGTYTIGITGYRWSGLSGPSTSTYSLSLTVNQATVVDTDGDGIPDTTDTDDDGDGVADTGDAFPLDASESVDTDRDGTGNNADTDDDGDGVADSSDAFPLNASESLDTDGDGIGDNSDSKDDRIVYPVPLNLWTGSDTADLGNGWYQSSWFGSFYGNISGWTYHIFHGWLFITGTNEDGFWLYDETLGWLYTGKNFFPWFYRNSTSHWLHDQSGMNTRKFWNSSSSSTIQLTRN